MYRERFKMTLSTDQDFEGVVPTYTCTYVFGVIRSVMDLLNQTLSFSVSSSTVVLVSLNVRVDPFRRFP